MLKKNNSGNISKNNFLTKKKSLEKLFISKSKRDLRTFTNYSINNKRQLKKLSLNIDKNNIKCADEIYANSINNNKNSENIPFITEKSINIIDISKFFAKRKNLLNLLNLSNNKTKNSNERICIYDIKPKTPLLLNRNKNLKIFNVKSDKDKFNENNYLPNQRIIINSDEKRKSKKIKERKMQKLNSQKNLKVNYNIAKNINIRKNNSFDIMHKNISEINKNNDTQKEIHYIKVNRNKYNKNKDTKNKLRQNKENITQNKNINSLYISKALDNNQKKTRNDIKKNILNKKNQNNSSNDFNVFLDKEYQERFVKRPKITKVKYDKFNADKQKEYNTILVKKKNYNLNNLTATISSISTSNSSQRKKRDWVYRLYNEEMNKRKLENKIINSLRKSILKNAESMKQKNEIKIKENSKYDKYGNYKTFNTDNNFINNLINSNEKKLNQKRKLCLNKIINNNINKEVQNKTKINKIIKRYGRKKKKSLYVCNEDLINEEDEEKEISKEEN